MQVCIALQKRKPIGSKGFEIELIRYVVRALRDDDLFCVGPAGGAVTLKVTVTPQHARLPPNCRNPFSC